MNALIFDVVYSINDLPKREPNQDHSDDVLIDVDGDRKYFQVGWYDFESKKWILYCLDIKIEPSMCWRYLSLAKYDL